MAEKYQPTEEEMARAEATMLPLQKELSEKRARVIELLREKGVEGFLVVTHYGHGTGEDGEPRGDTIEGILNRHKLWVNKYNGYYGWIGHWMNPYQAEAVWDKFHEIGEIISTDELHAARDELISWTPEKAEEAAAAEALKDIL